MHGQSCPVVLEVKAMKYSNSEQDAVLVGVCSFFVVKLLSWLVICRHACVLACLSICHLLHTMWWSLLLLASFSNDAGPCWFAGSLIRLDGNVSTTHPAWFKDSHEARQVLIVADAMLRCHCKAASPFLQGYQCWHIILSPFNLTPPPPTPSLHPHCYPFATVPSPCFCALLQNILHWQGMHFGDHPPRAFFKNSPLGSQTTHLTPPGPPPPL